MSFKITRAAIHNRKVRGMHKLVLIIIADHEGGDYGSWASIARIADLAGISPRQTKRIIKELAETGELIVIRQDGHHGTNRYFVVNKSIPKLTNRGDTRDTGGDTHDTPGVTPVTPEHIKKRGTPSGVARDGVAERTPQFLDAPQGIAQAHQNEPKTNDHDTPKYVPPRCLHNPLKSVLKCEQCSTAYRNGEI